MGKNILTIFAGRENNLIVLNKYLIKALDLKLLDEIHYWDYTRNNSDELYLKSICNNKFHYMKTTTKSSWTNYYNYYDKPEYKDDIIIKCDDDILFIDLSKLGEFINYTKTTDNNLVFANTINNGVSAYYQQHKFNLIPKELMELEYPVNGFCGSLWESGTKAEQLHNYFIDNYKSFLDYNYNNAVIPITTRFSINFIAIKGSDWNIIKDCGNNDEHNLTVTYVKNNKLKNVLYTNFYVAHLSFYRQEETNINSTDLRVKYEKLANSFLN